MNCLICLSQTAVFLASFMSTTVWSFPKGAPCGIKSSLLPNPEAHGENKNANSKAPFQIVVLDSGSKEVTCLKNDTKYTVKLKPIKSKEFKGFVIQSASGKGEPIGRFGSENSYKFLCDDDFSTITHKNNEHKKNIEAKWSTDKNIEGDIQFKATVVEDISIYWTNIVSKSFSACNVKSS